MYVGFCVLNSRRALFSARQWQVYTICLWQPNTAIKGESLMYVLAHNASAVHSFYVMLLFLHESLETRYVIVIAVITQENNWYKWSSLVWNTITYQIVSADLVLYVHWTLSRLRLYRLKQFQHIIFFLTSWLFWILIIVFMVKLRKSI